MDKNFTKSLNSLVDRRPQAKGLAGRSPAPEILGARGVGLPVVPTAGSTTGDLIFVETLVVYSEIIITEDGAFEVPEDWPDSNSYTFSAVPPDPLPQSLFYLSGLLRLDTKVQYYLQKRVHLIFYEQRDGDNVIGSRQDSRFVRFEYPYLGSYASGINQVVDDFVLSLKGDLAIDINQVTLDKQADLAGGGVGFG
jgi:hypothetical protein